MKNRLLLLLASTITLSTVLAGGGTYALFSGATANGPNDFSTFQAENIDVQNTIAPVTTSGVRTFAALASSSQPLQFPMFYDSVSYPTGQNPYDLTKGTPSGEIPGDWAPGDSVARFWSVNNVGSSAKFTEVSAKLDSLTGPSGMIAPGTQTYNDFLNDMNIAVYSPEDNYTTPVFDGTFQQLVSGYQPLNTVMYVAKGRTGYKPKFVATLGLTAGNDLQAVKGVFDFSLLAEQTSNNCFDPPFSNEDYSMKIGSTTPIKFEDYDSNGSLINSTQSNVSLVITGPKVGGGTLKLVYTLDNGLSANGGHYQAQVYGDPSLFVQESNTTPLYTATVYFGNQMCCQKSFSTYPGNRSNA